LCIGCLRCVRICRDGKGVDALGYVIKDDKIITGYRNNVDKGTMDCHFCGLCVEVCPTGALQDRDVPFHDRERHLIPCKSACPAGIDIPLYVEYIAKAEFEKAKLVIRENVPFPNSLGKVCFHPCEDDCRRGELSDPISICALKDSVFQTDENDDSLLSTKPNPTNKNVAVIGAGPCGLTAGYYLSRKGHNVTVFDANEEPGGMLRYGIPDYRLPADILKKDIDFIKTSGVKIELNQKIGENTSLSSLKDQGYNAIFIAIGAWKNKKIDIEGIDLEGIEYGVDFLIKHAKGSLNVEKYKDKKITIIGGGNVAIDAARTAIRLKPESVDLICLEKLDEMPAYPWEIKEAKDEGINIMNSWGPMRINGSNGNLSGLTFKKCTEVFDESGSFKPQYDESETRDVTSDVVILSIGQEHDANFSKDFQGLNLSKSNIIEINKDSLSTSVDGIFAGGDAVTIPASVIDAIESGRKVAISIDKYLGGDGDISENYIKNIYSNIYVGKAEKFGTLNRVSQKEVLGNERTADFSPFLTPYNSEEAKTEAERCLKCHHRFLIKQVVSPPEPWLPFDAENIAVVPSQAGVYKLLDSEKKLVYVCGTMDIKQALEDELDEKDDIAFFDFEEDEMFTQRESELIQQFMQVHGCMPKYNEDLDDDLF